MAEGEEGWTWPTWGSGKGRSAEDRIEEEAGDLLLLGAAAPWPREGGRTIRSGSFVSLPISI
jgi:hypothetical protein